MPAGRVYLGGVEREGEPRSPPAAFPTPLLKGCGARAEALGAKTTLVQLRLNVKCRLCGARWLDVSTLVANTGTGK